MYVDFVKIEDEVCHHVLDQAPRYQSAKRMQNETAAAAWDALKACWMEVYFGTNDVITHDAGTKLSSREFHTNCDRFHIRFEDVPKGAPQSMDTVERQNAALRRPLKVSSFESPSSTEEREQTVLYYH